MSFGWFGGSEGGCWWFFQCINLEVASTWRVRGNSVSRDLATIGNSESTIFCGVQGSGIGGAM